METLKRHTKRLVIDAFGYVLIAGGIALGWVPGPGGIPLIVAGLGLLSIHNAWAKRLRIYVTEHSSTLAKSLFPRWAWAEWGYDIVAFLLLVLTLLLELHHAYLWEIGLGVTTFCVAVFITLSNRGRLDQLRKRSMR